jgi:D-3-phosphoglycerate dehydrogenase/(S)-sulfolactate dehydrogenase
VTTSWLSEEDIPHRLLTDAGFDVHYARPADRAIDGRSLAAALEGADGVIAGVESFDAETLGQAPHLRVIARTGAGYDNVDVAAASRLGMLVYATPQVNRQSVAEFTIGSLLNLARGLTPGDRVVRAGLWTQSSGWELNGKTLGIIGFGAIGRTVADIAKGFGMHIMAYDPFVAGNGTRTPGVSLVELPELLERSDAVTLHVFLSDDTRHIIDAAALDRMKPGAVLINAARGGVVDEDALVDALLSSKLSAAALDTFEAEPLPQDSRLRQVEHLLLTPHVGGATVEARAQSGAMAAQSIIQTLAGQAPSNAVNADLVATG